jgi:hypothetical protein
MVQRLNSDDLDEWLRRMRVALEALYRLDVGYKIGINVVRDPVPEGKGSPEVFREMYAVTDGLELPDVYNGYFVDRAVDLSTAASAGEPTHVSGKDPMDIQMFGSDGVGGRFVVRDDDHSVWYLPSEAAVRDGIYRADEHSVPVRLSSSVNEFLWRLLGDVEAYVSRDTNHVFMGDRPGK